MAEFPRPSKIRVPDYAPIVERTHARRLEDHHANATFALLEAMADSARMTPTGRHAVREFNRTVANVFAQASRNHYKRRHRLSEKTALPTVVGSEETERMHRLWKDTLAPRCQNPTHAMQVLHVWMDHTKHINKAVAQYRKTKALQLQTARVKRKNSPN